MIVNSNKRVLAIGLDSATPTLIERWIKEDKLPVFKRLMESGCYGRLGSTDPALTPPAWTTSVTGVNPGKHNIYDFFRITPDHGKEITNAADRCSKAIWNLLDERGKRSLIFNLPLTYPAETFNGIMVTGMPTPNISSGFVSPGSSHEEVLKMTDGKPLAVDMSTLLRGNESAFLQDLEAVTGRITQLAVHFIKKEAWEFCMVVFDDLDRLQHTFWHYMDPAHPFYDPEEAGKYENAILAFHRFLEQQIEHLLSLIDDQTLVIIFSDHGMGPVYRNFYINRFFAEKGWLQLREQRVNAKEFLRRLGVSQERLLLLLDTLGLRGLARRIIPIGVKKYVRKYFPAESLELEFFDWSKILSWGHSKAYLCSRTGQGIMINRGNVDDYEAFREEIIASLLGLKDPDTGRCPVKNAFKKEDVFFGPHAGLAPDIIIEPAETFELQERLADTIFQDIHRSRIPVAAHHAREGVVFVCGGGNLQKGQVLVDPHISDITPTVLHYLGYPVPEEMDGKVIAEIFTADFLEKNPVSYNNIPLAWNGGRDGLSSTEQAVISERLKDLGYL